MKEKILSILLMIFTFIFLFYPTSFGITNLRAILVVGLLFCGVLFVCNKLKNKIKIKEKYYIWIVILLAIITRIGSVLVLEPYINQVSDFKYALDISYTLDFDHSLDKAYSMNFVGDYYKVFTHWILYPTIINLVYNIFGGSQLVALLFNAVTLIFCSIFVYKIASILFKKKSSGLIAALIYIFWPANILYTLICTQEHICTLILLIALYLFLKCENNNSKFDWKKSVTYLAIGALLGLSIFFKNFAPVFIIAFVIYFILQGFREKKLKKYVIYKLITIIVIVLSFVGTKAIIFNVIDNLVGTKVARNNTACYLNVGLRGKGTYSYGNYKMYFETLKETNYDYDKTNSQIIENLFAKGELDLSTEFFEKKAEIVFAGDSARLDWVSRSAKVDGHEKLANVIKDYIVDFNDYFFSCLVFLMAIGLIVMNKEKNLKIFVVYLIFLGCMLLLLLVEAQNRYMYSIQPIICILAVAGINYINTKIKMNYNKKNME